MNKQKVGRYKTFDIYKITNGHINSVTFNNALYAVVLPTGTITSATLNGIKTEVDSFCSMFDFGAMSKTQKNIQEFGSTEDEFIKRLNDRISIIRNATEDDVIDELEDCYENIDNEYFNNEESSDFDYDDLDDITW